MRIAFIALGITTAAWAFSALTAPRPTARGTYRVASAPTELPPTEFAAFAAG